MIGLFIWRRGASAESSMVGAVIFVTRGGATTITCMRADSLGDA